MSDYADAYLARRTGPLSEPPVITDRHGIALCIGDRVCVQSPFDRAHGVRPTEGRIVGAAIQSDPQGIEGCVTVDVGNGCHTYAPPSWLERAEPDARLRAMGIRVSER